MKFVLCCHSLISDWNHGNAHFLRGLIYELQAKGHDVQVLEPHAGWSLQNLIAERGYHPIEEFRTRFSTMWPIFYKGASDPILEQTLADADLVIVHEWNELDVVKRIGDLRRQGLFRRLLFHDTHHRSLSQPQEMERYSLEDYDGALVFGAVIKDIYERRGWTNRAWVMHEAADVRIFRPRPEFQKHNHWVWVGNWGDGERSEELQEFLIEPSRRLALKGCIHGVRYPEPVQEWLSEAGITYRGWIANYEVPEAFARASLTVHIPRGPYRQSLPGIPTIRVFESLACGIPLISAPWEDSEGLFSRDRDFLMVSDGRQMERRMNDVLNDSEMAAALSRRGLATIEERHTCRHRADELLKICRTDLGLEDAYAVAN
jgi:spore maturation protein CgeB